MKYSHIQVYWIILANTLHTFHCCYAPQNVESNVACDALSPYLVNRTMWKSKEPSGIIECLTSPVDYIIIHHTALRGCTTTETCIKRTKKLQKIHKKIKKWRDIGYHFLIGGDGRVYEGRPWQRVGAHTKYHNRNSISIAFVGNYDKICPTDEMVSLVPKIVYCGTEKGYVKKNFQVIGHRDAYCTSCPGDSLYDLIKQWPPFPSEVPIPSYTCDANTNTTEAPDPESTDVTEEPDTETEESIPVSDTQNELTTPTPRSVYYYILVPP
ncbi:Peptidoglycan-recognition protein SB1, partial [Stegodyphus mimosarum]